MLVWYDEEHGILRSTVKQILTLDDCQRYMAELIRMAGIARARAGRVFHLVDSRDAPVQPAQTGNFYAGMTGTDEVQVDKVAAVMNSALLKLQSRRLYTDPPLAIFDDPDEALAWLLGEQTATAVA